eukprot:7381090-Prymnesium_polylepis.1
MEVVAPVRHTHRVLEQRSLADLWFGPRPRRSGARVRVGARLRSRVRVVLPPCLKVGVRVRGLSAPPTLPEGWDQAEGFLGLPPCRRPSVACHSRRATRPSSCAERWLSSLRCPPARAPQPRVSLGRQGGRCVTAGRVAVCVTGGQGRVVTGG